MRGRLNVIDEAIREPLVINVTVSEIMLDNDANCHLRKKTEIDIYIYISWRYSNILNKWALILL